MTKDYIKYEQRIQHALRDVIRDVLAETARNGMRGEHYFYISFATTAPGVIISKQLLQEHPDDMTIILQHQYEDLSVSEHQFSVQLRFANRAETLVVPFTAITRFYDPNVNFGLAFESGDDEEATLRALDDHKEGLDEFYTEKANIDETKIDATLKNKQATPRRGQNEARRAQNEPRQEAHIVDLDSIRRKKNSPPQQK